MLLLWFVGALVFGAAYERGLFVPSPDKVIEAEASIAGAPGVAPPGYQLFNKWIYALDVILPVIDFQQESYWIPVFAEDRPKSAPRLKQPSLPDAFEALRSPIVQALDQGTVVIYWIVLCLGWPLSAIAVTAFAKRLLQSG
jgi:hypothetical protein